MLLIIALLLITDVVAFIMYTMKDNKNEEWFELIAIRFLFIVSVIQYLTKMKLHKSIH